MKKLIFTLAILLQVAVTASAFEQTQPVKPAQTAQLASLKHQKVRMYRQPGLQAEVIKNLSAADEVLFIRKHNDKWSIVTVNGEVGYVLSTSLKVLQSNMETGRTAAANK